MHCIVIVEIDGEVRRIVPSQGESPSAYIYLPTSARIRMDESDAGEV